MFATADCAAETDSLISEFLDILGWSHAKTGSKAQPFSEVFSVLGDADRSEQAVGRKCHLE